MANRRTAATSLECGDASTSEMTPAAATPAAHINHGEGKNMHVVTKRAVIAAAAVAAAGLFGSLSNDGSLVAQSDAPVVHHDVALVDSSTDAALTAATAVDYGPLLTAEIAYDNALYTNFVAPTTGLESTLFAATPHAGEFFDTAGTGGIFGTVGTSTEYLNSFDGAFTSLYNGYLADAVAFEDGLNNAVGGSTDITRGELLGAFNLDYVKDLVGTTPFPGSDVAPDPSTMSAFDIGLTTIANDNFTAAANDFTAYLTYLGADSSQLAKDGFDTSLTTILTSLGSGFEGTLNTLSTDLSTIVTDLIKLF